MTEEGKHSKPSPNGPKFIGKVFAARNLTKSGPASYAYAMPGFKDVKFVDVGVFLQNGKRVLNRTLVIQDAKGSWYVHPSPSGNPLLSDGLNDGTPSAKDFSEAYNVKK
ncbi:hypothetical protein EON83_01970 [bacterium]|nr:MAG: hypothetical protein EON83_01970 [bacterium]